MSQEVAKQKTPMQSLVATVSSDDFKREVALALPEGTTPDRFARIAITALLENPDLAQADPNSVYQSLLKSAGDGLLPDGREAALVLFKPKTGKPKAAYLPMIGGFRKIAADHGWNISTHAVYEADRFDYQLGERPTVQHSPAPLGEARGDIVAAYAVGRHLASGRTVLEVMTRAEVDKVRKTAKSKAIWDEWPERMTEKTVGRRLFKSLPLGSDRRAASIIESDEAAPEEAQALVYGSPAVAAQTDGEAPPKHPDPVQVAQEQEAAPSPPAPFSGVPPGEPEVDFAAFTFTDEAWSETRYHGKTLADIVEARDVEWLEWLSSEAISDEHLRDAAAAGLRKIGAA